MAEFTPEQLEAIKKQLEEIQAISANVGINFDTYAARLGDSSQAGEAIVEIFSRLHEINIDENLTAEENVELLRQRSEIMNLLISQAEKNGSLSNENISRLKLANKEAQRQVAIQYQNAIAIEKSKDKLIGVKKETLGISTHLAAISEIWNKMSKEEALGRVFNFAADSIGKFAKAIYTTSINFDDITKKLQTQTGTEMYNKSLLNLRLEGLKGMVVPEKLAESYNSLHEGFAGFSKQSVKTQEDIALTTAVMEKMGFSTEASVTSFRVGMMALGKSATQVRNFNTSLKSFSEQTGISMATVSKNLASSSNNLSVYGSNFEQVFKGLQLASKNTGVEMSNLINLASQFETFEGAASAAGKLNSILGGNFINSLDLMNVALDEPHKLVQMLKDSMDASGKSFDDMTPAMKRVVAEAAGFKDISEAAQIFNNDSMDMQEAMEAQAKRQEELEEINKRNATTQEKLNNIMAKLVPVLEKITNMMHGLLDFVSKLADSPIAQWFVTWGGKIAIVAGGIAVMTMGLFKLVAAAGVVRRAFGGPGIFANFVDQLRKAWRGTQNLPPPPPGPTSPTSPTPGPTGPTPPGGSQLSSFSKNALALGRALDKAKFGLLAFGAAVLMAGFGIKKAAEGMSELVKAFKDLDADARKDALYAIATVMGGMVLTVVALALSVKLLGAAGTAGAVGLLALGASVLLIGIGIKMAAEGMATLVSSFADVGNNASLAVDSIIGLSIGFGVLVAALIGVATFGSLSIPALLTIGAVALAAGAAMYMAASGTAKVIEAMSKLVPTIVPLISIFSPLVNALGEVWKTMASLVKEGLLAFINIIPNFVSSLKDIIINVQNIIGNMFTTVFSFIGNFIDKVSSGVPKFISSIIQSGLDLVKGFAEGIGNSIKFVFEGIGKFISVPLQFLKDSINMISSNIQKVVTTISGILITAVKSVTDAISMSFTTVKDVFNELSSISFSEIVKLPAALFGVAAGFTAISFATTAGGFIGKVGGIIGIKGPLETLQELGKTSQEFPVSNLQSIADSVMKISEALSKPIENNFVNELVKIAETIDNMDLEKIKSLNIKTNIIPPEAGIFDKGITATTTPVINTVNVSNVIIKESLRTEQPIQTVNVGSQEPKEINIDLKIPINIDGTEFKYIMTKVAKEEIEKNSNNAAAVNLRIRD